MFWHSDRVPGNVDYLCGRQCTNSELSLRKSGTIRTWETGVTTTLVKTRTGTLEHKSQQGSFVMKFSARNTIALDLPTAVGMRGRQLNLKQNQNVTLDNSDTFIRSDAIATGFCPSNRLPEIWPPAANHITQHSDRINFDRVPVARTVNDLTSQVNGYDRSAITAGLPDSRRAEPSQTEPKNEERDADQCIANRGMPDCDHRRGTTGRAIR